MRRAVALAAALAALLAAAPATVARPLAMGFFDGPFPTASDPKLERAVAVGASVVRVDIGWPAARPPAEPTNPADPAYDFASADATIRSAAARGLRVLVSFTGAPTWAEGPDRPADAFPRSWRPDPQEVGAYGSALARRYDGHFTDARGATLPRVRWFQL